MKSSDSRTSEDSSPYQEAIIFSYAPQFERLSSSLFNIHVAVAAAARLAYKWRVYQMYTGGFIFMNGALELKARLKIQQEIKH